MSPARLTAAEARALGLTTRAARVKTTRKAAPSADCASTRCVTCGAVCPRPKDEDTHFAANPDHRKYEVVLTPEGTR